MKDTIKIKVNDIVKIVSTKDYITAKTKQLQEFGYEKLTESEVKNELEKIYNNKKLTVIGMFMVEDIVKE